MLLATIPSGTYYFGDVLEIISNKYIDFVEEYKNNIFNEIKIEDKKYYLTLIPIISDIITYYTTNEEDTTLECGNNKEKTINIKNNYFGIIDENLIDKSKLNNNYILEQKIEFETMFSIYYYNNESLQNSLKIVETNFDKKNDIIFQFNKIENIKLYDYELISILPSGNYIIGYVYDLIYREFYNLIEIYNNYEINNIIVNNMIKDNEESIKNHKIKLNDYLVKLDAVDNKRKKILKMFIDNSPSVILLYENNNKTLNTFLNKDKIYYAYSDNINNKKLINSLNNFKYDIFEVENNLFGLCDLKFVNKNKIKYGTIHNFNYPIFLYTYKYNNGYNNYFIIKSKDFYLEIKPKDD